MNGPVFLEDRPIVVLIGLPPQLSIFKIKHLDIVSVYLFLLTVRFSGTPSNLPAMQGGMPPIEFIPSAEYTAIA